MSYRRSSEKPAAYRRQIQELREQLRAVQRDIEPEPVQDYASDFTFVRATRTRIPSSA
jgi:hypothetical protein